MKRHMLMPGDVAHFDEAGAVVGDSGYLFAEFDTSRFKLDPDSGFLVDSGVPLLVVVVAEREGAYTTDRCVLLLTPSGMLGWSWEDYLEGVT